MKSPDDWLSPGPNDYSPRHPIDLDKLSSDIHREITTAKEKIMIEQVEIKDGKVPSPEEVKRHGRINIYEKDKQAGRNIEHFVWKGHLLAVFELVFELGKFNLKVWKAYK